MICSSVCIESENLCGIRSDMFKLSASNSAGCDALAEFFLWVRLRSPIGENHNEVIFNISSLKAPHVWNQLSDSFQQQHKHVLCSCTSN